MKNLQNQKPYPGYRVDNCLSDGIGLQGLKWRLTHYAPSPLLMQEARYGQFCLGNKATLRIGFHDLLSD